MFFGEIIDKQMVLNEYGLIIKQQLWWLENNFVYIKLNEFVIMPNHVHGIIIINETQNVETCHGMSLQTNKNEFSKPVKNSLSVIVNQFKGAVKRYCNKCNAEKFEWQRGFYDR